MAVFVVFLHLLKAKFLFLSAANIPVIATLLVLGTSGFLISATIPVNGEDDERGSLTFVVTPLESRTCVDALIAQTETLLQLDLLAQDATIDLRHLRERARERADDQHKLIDEAALRAQYNTFAAKIPSALADARKAVLDAADLSKCQDLDPKTSVELDVAQLQAKYDAILRSFGQAMNGILADAQSAFDQLVASAQPRPHKKHHDDDEDEDDD